MAEWFTSSASPSRPSSRQSSATHSRAASEASFTTALTERPGSAHSTTTRSIARDIEHIKSLITRTHVPGQPPSPTAAAFPNLQNPPPSPKNIITAQVFRRNRSGSTPLAEHAQILQELDQLKRRIRQQEQHQSAVQQHREQQLQLQMQFQDRTPTATRRTFLDPDAEQSESDLDTETEDTPDEREEEIQRQREELAQVRSHGEQLLEAAEQRYDSLMGEKEKLEHALERYQLELQTAQNQRAELQTALQETQQSLTQLTEQFAQLRGDLADARRLLDTLREEKQEAETSRDDALARVEYWKTYKAEMSGKLENTKSAHAKELEALKKEDSELKTTLESERQQTRHLRNKLSTSEDSHARRVQALEIGLAETTKQLTDGTSLKAQLAAKISELETAQTEVASLQTKAEQLTEELMKKEDERVKAISELEQKHTAALAELKVSLQGDMATLQKEFEEKSKQTVDNHGKEIEKLRESHKVAMRRAGEENESKVRRLQQQHAKEIKKVGGDHTRAIGALKTKHEEALKTTKAEHDQRVRQLTDSGRQEQDRLETKHSETVERVRKEAGVQLGSALEAAKRQTNEQLSQLRAQHAKDLAERNELHEAALAAAQAEYKTKLAAQQQQHDAEVAKIRLSASQSEQAAADADARIKSLEAAHHTALEQARDEHAVHLIRSQQDFDKQLTAFKEFQDEEMATLRRNHGVALQQADQRYKALQLSHKDSLQDLRARHDEHVSSLRSQHQSELQAETEKALRELSDAVAAHEASFASLQDEHEARVADLTASLARAKEELEGLRTAAAEDKGAAAKLKVEVEMLRAASKADKAAVETGLQGELDALRASAAAEKATMEAEHKRHIGEIEQTWISMMNDLRGGHVRALQKVASQGDMRGEAARSVAVEIARLNEELSDTQVALRKAQTAHNDELAQKRKESIEQQKAHEEALQSAMEEKRKELKKMEAMIQQSLEEELSAIASLHQKSVQKLQASHEAQLAAAEEKSQKVLAEREAVWESKIARLTKEHKRTFSDAQVASEGSNAQQISQLEQKHAEELKAALAAAAAEADERAAAAERAHRAALESAVEKTRQQAESDVKKLKRRHQDAVAEVRLITQKQSQFALGELEDKHRQALNSAARGLELAISTHEAEMVAAQKTTAEMHQAELLRLENEYQVKLAEERRKLLDDKTQEFEQKQQSFSAEIASLHARLDHTLTGQAEAERSLAVMRKQSAEGEKRIAEVRDSMEEQLKALREEKEDLATQLRQSKAAFEELQAKLVDDEENPAEEATTDKKAPTKEIPSPQSAVTSRRASMHQSEFTIARLEQELSAARALAQRRLDEKSEMVRQNDFLIKELEVLLAQRSHAKNNSTSNGSKADAEVQTEPFVAEPKTSQSAARQIKPELLRPKTPLSPGSRQAREEIEQAWEGRSFENYLRRSQAELSELGGVISANEALFAMKVKEHAGDVQRAKELLSLEYQEKFDKLAWEKERMEKLVTVQQQAEFAKDRRRLVASYGAAETDDIQAQASFLNSLPPHRAKALRSAEQNLIKEYSGRLAKRKSEIALKHAEEFQSLTLEHDQKVADLLNGGARTGGAISANSMDFDFDLTELETSSVMTEKDNRRHSYYGTPRSIVTERRLSTSHGDRRDTREGRSLQRTSQTDTSKWTSAPRTSHSLPRSRTPGANSRHSAPPVPHNKPPVDVVSPARYTFSETHAPITTHSLIRSKVPGDVMPPPPKTPTGSVHSTLRPKTPNSGGSGPLIMKSSGAGPVIPARRSLPPGSIPQQQPLPQPGLQYQPLMQPADFERQQASTIALARERMSLDAQTQLQNASRALRSTQPNATALPQRQSPPPPVPQSMIPQRVTPSPTANFASKRDSVPPSPQSNTSSKRSSIFNLKRNKSSKRLSSGLIYWKPPKQQTFEEAAPAAPAATAV